MGAKTSKPVDFERLAQALTDYRAAYLVTVDDDYRVHTVDVEPELNEHEIDVGAIGGRTRHNVENRSTVTLLWPPREPGGYSLIVDGIAHPVEDNADGTATFRVTPTRALLHRKAGRNARSEARHDCVVFSLSGPHRSAGHHDRSS